MGDLNLNTINIYAKISRQHDVVDRIQYITQRQGEKMVCIAGNQNLNYWQRLALECNRATRNSKSNKATQAREIIAYIPNEFLELTKEEQKDILDELAELVRKWTGTDCIIAAHNSHPNDDLDGNAHLHILISERPFLHKREIRFAERNLYYDENNHRRRNKSAVMDEFGELKNGCYIISKDEVVSIFGAKYSDMDSPRWSKSMKMHLAEWINAEFNPDKERVLYTSNSPFIPQQHVGKEYTKEIKERIREDNVRIKKWNRYIREGIISIDEAMWYKPLIMSAPERGREAEAVYMGIFNKDFPGDFEINEFMGTVERTSKPLTSEELNKRELRRLYRSAHIERTLARDADTDEDKIKHQRLARHYSAEIDRMHKELGHWDLTQYSSEIQKDEAELEALQSMIEETKYRISVYASQSSEISLAKYRTEKRNLVDLYVAEKALARQIAKNHEIIKTGDKDAIKKMDFSKRLESVEARKDAKAESFKNHSSGKEMVLYSCDKAQAIIDSFEIQQQFGIQNHYELMQSIEFYEKNLVRLKEALARNEDLEDFYRRKKLHCEQSELLTVTRCIENAVEEQKHIKQLLALREEEYLKLKRADYGNDMYHGFIQEEYSKSINYTELFERHKPTIDYDHKEY